MTGNWLIATAIITGGVVACVAIICYAAYRCGRN